jgi:hypothetical protein
VRSGPRKWGNPIIRDTRGPYCRSQPESGGEQIRPASSHPAAHPDDSRGQALARVAQPRAQRLEVPPPAPDRPVHRRLRLRETKLIVEVDGATHSAAAEITRDAERTRLIEACGFTTLRITNADIPENPDGVRETILAALERRETV